MNMPVRLLVGAAMALGLWAEASPLVADDLFITTGSSLSLFDINGVVGGGTSPIGSFGPSGVVTGFSAGQGNVWVVSYNSGVSTVQEYTGGGNVISGDVFQVTAPVQNGAVGPGGNLYFSAASGDIYEYSGSTLGELASWNIGTGNPNVTGTQYSAVGIASDGTNLYTTEGDAGSFIDQWNANGQLQGSLDVGVPSLYGLGLNGGDFFAGTPANVLEFDASGDFLNAFGIGANNLSLSAGEAPIVSAGTPEPGTVPLMLVGALLAAGWLLARHRAASLSAIAVVFITFPAAYGQIRLSVNPSASSAPVGQQITVSVSASDPSHTGAAFTYQFNVLPPGLSHYSLVRDYSPANSFPFATTGSEGVYTVQVIALESNGSTATAATQLTFAPVATTVPVVSATAHPLVAMYSLPPCPVGSQARVHFRMTGAIFWTYTPYQNCTGNTSLNFLIGGMRASSTYTLQHDVLSGPADTVGPVMSFTTQAIPANILSAIPSYNISVAATGPNATAYPVLLTAPVGINSPLTPFAMDTTGHVIWYLPDFADALQNEASMTRPVPGGTFLVIANQKTTGDKQLLREYDLAGNILRETNATAIGNELAALGKDRITCFTHEVSRFPNGDTGAIGTVEKVMTNVFDSSSNTVKPFVDVMGDTAVVLDSNFHLKWSWNEFDHATEFATKTARGAPLPTYTGVLNDVCSTNAGCPPITKVDPSTGNLFVLTNDWTHSNSLATTPDGNLIISVRHQDMVIKITYNNGSGDGTILWRLGPQGDFGSSVPAGLTATHFFNSHQHDAEYESNGVISLFDNGNTRVGIEGGGTSRGQAWQIDDKNLTATRVVNVDLGIFATATGSAQRLSNNNYHFYLGYIFPNSQSVEVTATGTADFKVPAPDTLGYRSFRMNSLYSISGSLVYTPFYAVPPGR